MRTGFSSLAFAAVLSAMFAASCTTVDDTPDECTEPCRPAACSDGKRSPSEGETGVDCGGLCGACDGETCTVGTDCASTVCTEGKCAAPATKTCGVGLPVKCADAEKCQQDIDCISDYCDGTCMAPPPNVHEDGRRNGGETGKDCGGTAVDKPCPGGEACVGDTDCQGKCVDSVCAPPNPTDGKKNQGETDIDCGGPNAPKCQRGKVCITNADCQLLACASGTCGTPANDDGIINGSETDVDCGGAGVSEGSFAYKAPRCNELKKCTDDPDCKTEACSPAGLCVAKSCDSAETAGVTTCGEKEVGDPTAVHETCCKSLKLPTKDLRLDKYEVTAGRFRTFLAAAGPNIRQWVSVYAAQNPNSQLGKMIVAYPNVLKIYPPAKNGSLGVAGHMGLDLDNYNGTRGCYNGVDNYSANTYWQPDADLAEYGLPSRNIPRETSDAKSLNCAMPIMFAAFCAWDGGALATRADLLDAWGPEAFPWGELPNPQTADGKPATGNYNWCNGDYETGGFKCQNSAIGANGTFYRFPLGTPLMRDMEPLIASPGRFPLDATKLKVNGESWQDLLGNLVEVTGDFANTTEFCDTSTTPGPGDETCTRTEPGSPPTQKMGVRYTNVPNVGLVGRSWEGHVYDKGDVNAWPSTAQYGKFGGRCVRPVE
jgi:hypothetical protein